MFEVAWSERESRLVSDLNGWATGTNGILEVWGVKIFPSKLSTAGPNNGQVVRRMQFHRRINGILQPVVRHILGLSRFHSLISPYLWQVEFGSCLQGKNTIPPGPVPKTVAIPKAHLFAGSPAFIADQLLPAPLWSAGNVVLDLTAFFQDYQGRVTGLQ